MNYETVVRALGRKLAFLPDFSIAKVAQDLFERKSHGLKSPVYIKEWEELVFALLQQWLAMSYHIVLIIDALNEIDPIEDSEKLCILLTKIIEKFPAVSILLSSHENIWGKKRLRSHTVTVDIVAKAPQRDMESFIDGELEHRYTELKNLGSESIFCK